MITVASADALARLLDEQQHDEPHDACLQAMRTGTAVNLYAEAAHASDAASTTAATQLTELAAATVTAALRHCPDAASTCCAPSHRTGTSRSAGSPPTWSTRRSTPPPRRP